MAHVLVVEDDPIIRQTVEYALRRAGFDVSSSENGDQALEQFHAQKPDLILLDLMLPGRDGYSIAQEVRRTDKDVAIIMVTALDQERDKIRGLDAGADDYMTKPFSMEELLARVRANLRRVKQREVLQVDEIINTGDLIIEPSQVRVTVAGVPVKLRLKEFQLLVTLASNAGSLMTRQSLAEQVWGYEFLHTSRTIDVHIRRLRQALEELSAFSYVHTIHGMGYRFDAIPKTDIEVPST